MYIKWQKKKSNPNKCCMLFSLERKYCILIIWHLFLHNKNIYCKYKLFTTVLLGVVNMKNWAGLNYTLHLFNHDISQQFLQAIIKTINHEYKPQVSRPSRASLISLNRKRMKPTNIPYLNCDNNCCDSLNYTNILFTVVHGNT